MASKFADSAEHAVTCPLCYEFYADPHIPKDLDCPHTCCLVCLQNMVTLSPGEPIACPMRCEKKTRIPLGGVSELRTNLHLKNLAEEHPSYAKGEKPKVSRCAQHDEKAQLYCEPCNKLACQNCYILFHQGSGHTMKDIADVTGVQKVELRHVMKGNEEQKKSCIKAKEELEILEKSINASLQTEQERINCCVRSATKAATDMIEQEGERLKRELKTSQESNLAIIKRKITKLDSDIKALAGARDVAQQIEKSPDYAYITQHASLVQKMERLTVREPGPSIGRNPSPIKFMEETEIAVKLGRVMKTRHLELVQELEGFQRATRIGGSPSGLLAVTDFDAKAVIIYQKQHDQYVKQFNLELNPSNEYLPLDPRIHPDGRILLARCTGIEVYSSTGTYQNTISTQTSGMSDTQTNVCCLSALADGRILAGDIGRRVITVHDERGTVTKTIKTDIAPYCIASIGMDKLAVSDGIQGKLNVMDIESEEVTLSIDIPQVKGVCYDDNTNCILIARIEPADKPDTVWPDTGAIEQYCSITGKCVASLAQGLYNPHGITLIADRRLAVADKKTVKIYEVT